VLELGLQVALPQPVGVVEEATVLGTYDVGVAYPFKRGDFQLSAEAYGEVGLANEVESHHWIGPSFAWTGGRFWATLGVLVGLNPHTPDVRPRLLWAVAF
jgi:hypothetical protein